jgi:uncharacterized repeat protein (TIGR01451 family)
VSNMVKQAVLMGGAIAAVLLGGTLSSLMLGVSATQAQPLSPVMTQKKPTVELLLSVEKQVIQKNPQGKEIKTWLEMAGNNGAAKPGDVLRFTLKAENKGDLPAKKLTLVQPVPQGTVYMLNTAISESPASVVYSIDGSKTFVAKPTVKVSLPDGTVEARPAPAEAYTHVRWRLGRALAPKATSKVFYQVKVKS